MADNAITRGQLISYFTEQGKSALLSDANFNVIFGASNQSEYLSAAREVAENQGIAEKFEDSWNKYLSRKTRGDKTHVERSEKETEQIIGGKIFKADPNASKPGEKKDKTPITIESLADEYEGLGIIVRLNEITHEIEVNSDDPNLDYSSLITTTHSFLKGTKGFYTGVTFDNLQAYTAEIAKRNKYNPVLNYLKSIQYDQADHFGDLYSLMGIPEEDSLSRTLIKKWFYQGIVLLHNTENKHVAAEGVLTLVGPQGCGKTSLIEMFAIKPEWFARGATLNPNDKDTIRRCCSRWVIELGEVETTLRSDIEALKNFITNDIDVYRVPYGRTDLKYARRSNLAATCNSDRYLIDQSGNRRWWTVPINRTISHYEISRFNIDQLYAQALTECQCRGKNCFRLLPWEYDFLNSRNQKALKPIKAEDEVHDILEAAEMYRDDYKYVDITVTEWKTYHEGLKKYDSGTIGKVLKKFGIRQRQNGTERLYSLPIWKEAITHFTKKPKRIDSEDAG